MKKILFLSLLMIPFVSSLTIEGVEPTQSSGGYYSQPLTWDQFFYPWTIQGNLHPSSSFYGYFGSLNPAFFLVNSMCGLNLDTLYVPFMLSMYNVQNPFNTPDAVALAGVSIQDLYNLFGFSGPPSGLFTVCNNYYTDGSFNVVPTSNYFSYIPDAMTPTQPGSPGVNIVSNAVANTIAPWALYITATPPPGLSVTNIRVVELLTNAVLVDYSGCPTNAPCTLPPLPVTGWERYVIIACNENFVCDTFVQTAISF